MSEPSLREKIKADFGIDLPITGGQGDSSAPFVIEAKDALTATDIEADLMRCYATGRRNAWRWLGQERVVGDEDTIKVLIERVQFDAAEVVTERAGYFFRWKLEKPFPKGEPLPLPRGYLDRRSRLYFPYEIGWLHLTGITDNEVKHPGAGISAAYSGLGMKGTIYIYDGGKPVDELDAERIKAEFHEALNGALAAIPGAEVSHSDHLLSQEGQEKGWIAILSSADTKLSAVVLVANQANFVKARVTWDAGDEKQWEMGHECVAIITQMIC